MDITPLIPDGKYVLTGYGDKRFTINEQHVEGNILLTPDFLIRWDIESIDQFSIEALQPLLDNNPTIEVLLIGCGNTHRQLGRQHTYALSDKGVSIDVMTTGAACRTYSVLITEGRHVAAALIAV